jgi:hypothetical protein
MNRPAFINAPRCCATSKRTAQPCQAPAVRGWRVCRFHGAGGGAPEGRRNGAYRTGLNTNEMKAVRQAVRELVRASRAAIQDLREDDGI